MLDKEGVGRISIEDAQHILEDNLSSVDYEMVKDLVSKADRD